MIKKEDLRTGMKVKTKNGNEYIVMMDVPVKEKSTYFAILMSMDRVNFLLVQNDTYDDSLQCIEDDEFSITEVYVLKSQASCFSELAEWERCEEPIEVSQDALNEYFTRLTQSMVAQESLGLCAKAFFMESLTLTMDQLHPRRKQPQCDQNGYKATTAKAGSAKAERKDLLC